MREALVLIVCLAATLAGCTRGEPETSAADAEGSTQEGPTHVLAPAAASSPPRPTAEAAAQPAEPSSEAAIEPEGFDPPTFLLLGRVATSTPFFGVGEPGVWAALDGTLFVTFPGCSGDDETLSLIDSGCANGAVLRSRDGGKEWELLNDEDGKLAEDAPSANGDADLAVDAAGNVYAANLGSGVHVQVLLVNESAWRYVGNLVPEDGWSDREWLAAAGPGHVIATWMGGANDNARKVAVTTTRDAGANWSDVVYLGDRIGWLGSVQFAPDGRTAYIPFTEWLDDRVQNLAGEADYGLHVARTLDGGATWDVVDTGIRTSIVATSGHFSGMLMAPSLDITGDGHVVLAWSEEVRDPAGVSVIGAALKAIWSQDGGATWSAPLVLSEAASAIMPWVTGGAGDRFAITYLESDVPLDPDRVGDWRVLAAVWDGIADGEPRAVVSVIEERIHLGGACTMGGGCIVHGADRSLLDYFESDLLPDGRIIVAYPADPAEGAKRTQVRVALQDGGTPLLIRV